MLKLAEERFGSKPTWNRSLEVEETWMKIRKDRSGNCHYYH